MKKKTLQNYVHVNVIMGERSVVLVVKIIMALFVAIVRNEFIYFSYQMPTSLD